jgi:hypothetical protein
MGERATGTVLSKGLGVLQIWSGHFGEEKSPVLNHNFSEVQPIAESQCQPRYYGYIRTCVLCGKHQNICHYRSVGTPWDVILNTK